MFKNNNRIHRKRQYLCTKFNLLYVFCMYNQFTFPINQSVRVTTTPITYEQVFVLITYSNEKTDDKKSKLKLINRQTVQ